MLIPNSPVICPGLLRRFPLPVGPHAAATLCREGPEPVPGCYLRAELIKRLQYAETKAHEFPSRRNGVVLV